jgi:hypothetical protein
LIDEASSKFDASILTGPIANFPVADTFNRRLERDLSTSDIPNVFVTSFTYEFPIGKGKRFNPTGIAGTILGGWELAGVVQLQSGIPLAVTQLTRFFNTSAFTIAPQFTIGNSSRNRVRGPQHRNADIGLIKRTYFGENRKLEFRAEAFNVTNTPPLGAPATVGGAAGFGTITSAGDPRVLQFGLKINF